MMTNKEVKNIIQKELEQKPDLINGYGFSVEKCLIEPILQPYINSMNENEIIELWTVLEATNDRSGYKIVFDPNDNIFRLGILTNKNELMYLGPYRTFSETLRSI